MAVPGKGCAPARYPRLGGAPGQEAVPGGFPNTPEGWQQVAVVAADGLWTGLASVPRLGLSILNGVLETASATGGLHWVAHVPTVAGKSHG